MTVTCHSLQVLPLQTAAWCLVLVTTPTFSALTKASHILHWLVFLLQVPLLQTAVWCLVLVTTSTCSALTRQITSV
jgi:hypothetical protein